MQVHFSILYYCTLLLCSTKNSLPFTLVTVCSRTPQYFLKKNSSQNSYTQGTSTALTATVIKKNITYEISSASPSEDHCRRSSMPMVGKVDSVAKAQPRRSTMDHRRSTKTHSIQHEQTTYATGISAPGNLVQMGWCDSNSRRSRPMKPKRVFSIQEEYLNGMAPSSTNSTCYSTEDIRYTATALCSINHNKRRSHVMGNFLIFGNDSMASAEDDTIKHDTQANQIRLQMMNETILNGNRESFQNLKKELKQSGMATSAAAARHFLIDKTAGAIMTQKQRDSKRDTKKGQI